MPSGFLQTVFERFGFGSQVIPNVVDVERFRPTANSRDFHPHLVVARNLEHLYGNDIALRAHAVVRRTLPTAHLTIAGSGPERPRLEELARALDIADSVTFAGRLDVDEMVSLYGSADLVVNASRADNTPNSILEALACGVPVVSTEVGGVPYLVEHGRTAWLVPPDDADALAEGIVRVLSEAPLRDVLVKNGLALAGRCSWTAVRHQWLELYHSLVHSRSHSVVTMSGS